MPSFLRNLKKDISRAFGLTPLFLLGTLPFTILVAPKAGFTILAVCSAVYFTPQAAPVRRFFKKHTNWFTRLSKQGPVFRLFGMIYRVTKRLAARVLRGLNGDKLDVPTVKPVALGATRTGVDRIELKWMPAPYHWLSKEWYQLDVKDGGDWQTLSTSDTSSFTHTGLKPGGKHTYRIQAVNSKGASQPLIKEVYTKQYPVDGGGKGDGYTWTQDGKTVTVHLQAPEGTRSKDLIVRCMPSELSVTHKSAGLTLLSAPLTDLVHTDEMEWELCDSQDGRSLSITLFKQKAAMKSSELWRSAFKGHPPIDTAYIKFEPKLNFDNLS